MISSPLVRRYLVAKLTRIISSKYLIRNMSDGKFVINEIEGDLFSAPNNYSLAHCVGADMSMRAGIAVKFHQIYGQKDKLLAQKAQSGDAAMLKDNDRYIYYLVTKKDSSEKPTYETLRSSLTVMRNHMKQNNVQNLAMPRIGCGIDGLEWDKVKSELQNVFSSEDVNITVYNFVPK